MYAFGPDSKPTAPEFPAISPQLIKALDQVFPDTLPLAVDFDERVVAALIGSRTVISRLKLEMLRQQGKR